MKFGNVDPATLAAEALPTTEGRGTGHAPLINYAVKNVQPPSALYVTVNDRIVAQAASFGIQPQQQIEIRYLLPDGSIQIQEEFITPGNNRTLASKSYPLTEGFLLSVSVAPSAGIQGRALCFVTIGLQRGSGSFAPDVYMLATGYTSVTAPLIWPGGRYEFSQQPPGWIQKDTVGNPAAGTDWTFTVPANDRVRTMMVLAILVTSATVATRQAKLVIDDGVSNLAIIPAAAAQLASLTQIYTFSPGAPNVGVLGTALQTGMMQGFTAIGGYRIRSSTDNIQAGDQWSAIALTNEHLMDL
jgi:hypothetical protein